MHLDDVCMCVFFSQCDFDIPVCCLAGGYVSNSSGDEDLDSLDKEALIAKLKQASPPQLHS